MWRGVVELLTEDRHKKIALIGATVYELERRLEHRSQRYIQRNTNLPEDVAACYVEGY